MNMKIVAMANFFSIAFFIGCSADKIELEIADDWSMNAKSLFMDTVFKDRERSSVFFNVRYEDYFAYAELVKGFVFDDEHGVCTSEVERYLYIKGDTSDRWARMSDTSQKKYLVSFSSGGDCRMIRREDVYFLDLDNLDLNVAKKVLSRTEEKVECLRERECFVYSIALTNATVGVSEIGVSGKVVSVKLFDEKQLGGELIYFSKEGDSYLGRFGFSNE